MHKPVRIATLSTLYPKNSFIHIARYRRSSLDGRGIFDFGRSLQVEFILLNISHTYLSALSRTLLPFSWTTFPTQLCNYSVGPTNLLFVLIIQMNSNGLVGLI